jgi:hypothetical protein
MNPPIQNITYKRCTLCHTIDQLELKDSILICKPCYRITLDCLKFFPSTKNKISIRSMVKKIKNNPNHYLQYANVSTSYIKSKDKKSKSI